MASRLAQKLGTRKRLMDAALELMSQGERSFSSLGLREVTRSAGVAPNTFYRHFATMEELGFALLDEGGLVLRRLLREIRGAGLPEREIVRRSVVTYRLYLQENRDAFLFVARERTGGSSPIRLAIQGEVDHFASELATDLGTLGAFPHMVQTSRRMIAEMIIEMMLDAATEILDLPAGRPDLEAIIDDRYVKRLVVILLGASAWREAENAGLPEDRLSSLEDRRTEEAS